MPPPPRYKKRSGIACRYYRDSDCVPRPYPALPFAFCNLEGGMHDHMTLHAYSNPLPSHSAVGAVGAVGVCYNKAKTGDCPGPVPSLLC